MTDKFTIRAPAKVNLTLEVLGKRADDFHEIRSVMQSVELCDVLTFESADEIQIKSDVPGWNADKSLVSGAVSLLKEKTGSARGVRIEIEKKIPLISGLGGDSSDAAATLKGLNEIWELELSEDELMETAAGLGSDVGFFIPGGTALATGRGEQIERLPKLAETWMVLVIPEIPQSTGKTARMYQSLEASHFTDGIITGKLVASIGRGENLDVSLLFNTFENIAFDDYVMRHVYVEHLEKLGAPRVNLAGAGPALLVIFKSENDAKEFSARCKDQGMEAYPVKTL